MKIKDMFRTANVELREYRDRQGYGEDIADSFFSADVLNIDEADQAYEVEDVDECIHEAKTAVNSGEFSEHMTLLVDGEVVAYYIEKSDEEDEDKEDYDEDYQGSREWGNYICI